MALHARDNTGDLRWRALTSAVEGAVDEIGAASSVCLNAGPNAGQAEIDSFTSHVNAAMAHYTRAQEIGAGAAGPCGG